MQKKKKKLQFFLAQKLCSLVLSICTAQTKSALLRVSNDIQLATDSGDSVILILLDLTLAFDTVDHKTYPD